MITDGLRQHFRRAVLIGILGGVYLTFYDTITTVWRGDVRNFILGDLLRILFVPLLVYVVASVLVMVTVGTLFFVLYRANRLPDAAEAHRSFQAGLFAFLASLFILMDVLDARSDTKPIAAYWEVFVFGLLISVGVAGAIFLVMRSVRNLSVRILIFSAPILLLALLAGIDIIRAKQLPRAFFSFSHKPKVTTTKKAEQTVVQTDVNRPNVLWIVLDTARADHFSSYGYARQTTPHMDALAKEGARYTRMISVAPWTLPSHASMLTGLFPSSTGADGAWPWLADDFTTLPEVLRQYGYATYGFSNNDNFGPMSNEHQGFDQFTLFTKGESLQGKLLLARTVRTFIFTIHAKGNFFGLVSLYQFLTGDNLQKDFGGALTTSAMIRTFDTAQNEKKPFFMFANYMEAHDPYGDSPDAALYLRDIPEPLSLEAARARRDILYDDVHAYIARKAQLTDGDRALLTALYDGDLHYLDNLMGQLMKALTQRKLLDNTLVIITSDHGENLGDRGLLKHVYDIHYNLTRIPFIIRYPAAFKEGTTVDDLVQSIDVFPTVLDVAGIADVPRKDLQGLSLLGKERHPFAVSEAQFVNDTFTRTRYVLPRFPDVDERYFGGVWRSILEGDLEYIETPNERMMYNVKDDPDETRNLIDANAKKAADLRAKLRAWITATPNYLNTFANP